jgi:dTDP-4-dehydrorhamnose reductase
MTTPQILQFGAHGQLALEVIKAGQESGVEIRSIPRQQVDFCDPLDVARIVREARADIVINLVGYTAVDKAETEPRLAQLVNAEAVGALAKACRERDLPLIHVSTDYVFDGSSKLAYVETDPTNPISVYGKSKLNGEQALAELNPQHVILRTSWVYSAYRQNFVKTMIRLGMEREQVSVVADQIGSPTSARDIAATLLAVADKVLANPASNNFGTFHYSGKGTTSWFEFAKAILAAASAWCPIKAELLPIDSKTYNAPAQRPANSCLDCTKIAQVYGILTVPWRQSLLQVLDELRGAQNG